MSWTVELSKKALKQTDKLPRKVRDRLFLLMSEIELSGPVRGDWPNYSRLSSNCHHCHLKKGSPTYVAVWKESEKIINLVEVIYAGTHEKSPY